jgi:hypothetical protein
MKLLLQHIIIIIIIIITIVIFVFVLPLQQALMMLSPHVNK